MHYWNIALAAYPGLEFVAEAVRLRLTESWRSKPAAAFINTSVDHLAQEHAEQLDAAVLVIDSGTKDPSVTRALTALDEHHVPMLALLEKSPQPGSIFEDAGVLVADRSAGGPLLCARLHGLLHRQREVDRLRRELAVARRSHEGLGSQVARIHEELQLAAHVQQELLPRDLPAPHGVTLAALWRPAQYVSGDIYDVIRLDEDHLGIFLADAVGHGVAAALMTMVVRQALVTRDENDRTRRILSPSEVLRRLNADMIRRQADSTRFATAVYAVVDCRSRRVRVAGAGHHPPLLVGTEGRSVALETSGGVLGVFKNETYNEIERELEVGDHLLLYSDGFEAAFARSESGDPSDKRCRGEIERLCSVENPQEMVDALARRIDSQCGSLHRVDDITLLCMKAGPLVPPPAAEGLAASLSAA